MTKQLIVFYIKSYDALTGLSSTSNEICLTIDIIASIRELVLKNISVNTNNEIEISWQWNADAELSDVSILSSQSNGNYSVIETLPPAEPLLSNNIYTDIMNNPSNGPIYFQIQTTDQCDSMALSNYGASIHLSGQANNSLQNFLTWTPFHLENATINQYNIYRTDTNGAQAIGQMTSDQLTFSDQVNPREESDVNICYYIVAEASVPLPNGSEEVVYAQSNTACIVQPSGILAPNAFAPSGKNYEISAYTPLWSISQLSNVNMGSLGAKSIRNK